MTRMQRSVAALALLGSPMALAEPYSGSPADEPIVRVLAWAILLGLCLGFSFLVAIVASRGRWRTRRFAGVLAGSFVVLAGAALLAGVLAGIAEIVSLILHIVLM